MAIWQGTFFSQLFTLKNCKTGVPIDITGWQFHAMFRLDPEDPDPPLLELTSAAGEFVIHDGPGGQFSMQIQAVDTATLPVDLLYFDVLRTTPAPAPIMLFWGSVPCKLPVTR